MSFAVLTRGESGEKVSIRRDTVQRFEPYGDWCPPTGGNGYDTRRTWMCLGVNGRTEHLVVREPHDDVLAELT